jgi:hypothetical protein
MARVVETEKLVEAIVRLRRAERVLAAAGDVAPVRRELESQVGPTLSRSRASRLLGVSQTALDRWVDAGRVPSVLTPRGRREVPLRFTVELLEEIQRLRDKSVTRHPLATALGKRREMAERLVIDAGDPEDGAPLDHTRAERRSLVYHRAVADRLDERLVDEARAQVDRLAAVGHLHSSYAERWREILAMPIDSIARQIVEDSQGGRDLRQNSPFAGVLNEQERRRLIELVR